MSSICEHSFKVLFRCVIYIKGQFRQLLLITKILVSVYHMIEFSVIFICVSERCFLCMILHDNVPWEREQESVCVHAHAYVCSHMCTCMNVSLYRGEMLHECQSVQGWNVTVVLPQSTWNSCHANLTDPQKKCRNRCPQILLSWSNKIFNLCN